MAFFISRRRLANLLVPVVAKKATMRRRRLLPGIPREYMRETPPPPPRSKLDVILTAVGGFASLVSLYGAIPHGDSVKEKEEEKENADAGDGRSRDAGLQAVVSRLTAEKGDGEMTESAAKGDGGNTIDLLMFSVNSSMCREINKEMDQLASNNDMLRELG